MDHTPPASKEATKNKMISEVLVGPDVAASTIDEAPGWVKKISAISEICVKEITNIMQNHEQEIHREGINHHRR